MALSYSPININKEAVEPVFLEILSRNSTIDRAIVNFISDVKGSAIITEEGFSVTMQAYTSGAPTASGTLGLTDREVTPVKVLFYDEYDPESLRLSRFGLSMAQGAWNMDSDFNNLLLEALAPKIAKEAENKYWNGATSATKTAVAALTAGTAQNAVGAAEKTYVAAAPSSQFDGVLTHLIYNNAAVGSRVKVAGTTLSSSNIKTEIDKVYAVIPASELNSDVTPIFYVPYSVKPLINIYNSNQTTRDSFSVTGIGTPGEQYAYNGLRIEFVPLPDNTMICGNPADFHWITDLMSDFNELKVDKIANNREDQFYKAIMSQIAHVTRQSKKVVYVG